MLAIFIGSCGIALSFIPVLLSTTQTHRQLKDQIINACYYFEGAFELCLMALCLWLIVKQKYLIERGLVQFPNDNNDNHISAQENTQSASTRRSRMLIVVFGIGGSVFIICTVMIRALQKQVLPSLQNFVLLLSFTIYSVAIYRYDGVSLKNKQYFTTALAL